MTWQSSEAQPVVVRQRFPAELLALPGATGPLPRQALVLLTRARLYVLVDVNTLILDEPIRLEDVTLRGTFDPPTAPESALTPAGTVTWRAGQGCGCSHPLKHFRPFTGAVRSGPTTLL